MLPGQAERTVTLYSRLRADAAGRVGSGVGYDAYRLRRCGPAAGCCRDAAISPSGSAVPLATTQHHYTIAGHPIVRHGRTRELQADRASGPTHEAPRGPRSTGPGPRDPAWAHGDRYRLCIGCNACVVACQAENNVPVVGKEQVAVGARDALAAHRSLLQRRRRRTPSTSFQPIPCMHCEKAPCEVGLPGQRHRARPRRPEPDGLQPLHRHAHLLQLLPLQGAALQLVRLHRRLRATAGARRSATRT